MHQMYWEIRTFSLYPSPVPGNWFTLRLTQDPGVPQRPTNCSFYHVSQLLCYATEKLSDQRWTQLSVDFKPHGSACRSMYDDVRIYCYVIIQRYIFKWVLVQIELSGPIDYSFNVGHHSNTVHHGWARYCRGSCGWQSCTSNQYLVPPGYEQKGNWNMIM